MTNVVAVGVQAGVLYAFIDMKLKNTEGQVEDIWPHPGLGFNAEATLTYLPTEGVVLQMGYRYQVFVLNARGPGRENITINYDNSHGPTMSLFYAF
jgi:hypothetical protein